MLQVFFVLVNVQTVESLFLRECPSNRMWTLRAKQLCRDKDKYMCLYDTNERKFRELCKDKPEFHRAGKSETKGYSQVCVHCLESYNVKFRLENKSKSRGTWLIPNGQPVWKKKTCPTNITRNIFVISGNLQYFAGRQCHDNRYQPTKWWTNGSSECQYLKSTCDEEGQVPYDDGTVTQDRKCRCDYTNYYDFVNSKPNKCHCDPKKEDCSCYRKVCTGDQVLTPDYDCVGVHEWTGRFVCPEYKPLITDKKRLPHSTICPNIKKGFFGTIQQSRARIAVSLILGILVILSIVVIIRNADNESLREMMNDVGGFFHQDPYNVECIEGEDVMLTVKVPFESMSVEWLKDGNAFTPNTNCEMSNEDTQHSLTLKNTKTSDGGEYCLKVGQFSKVLKLQVKAYFIDDPSDIKCIVGKDATFECKVLHDSPPVKWLRNGKEIANNKNLKITSKDSQHKLQLTNITMDDKGEYCVQIGKSFRKVLLNIKAIPSDDEKRSYIKAINDETDEEDRQYLRIHVIGKDRVGKTCLVRRLLGQGIENVISTDGIDIVKTCQIRKEDGKWFVGEVDTERRQRIRRIHQAVSRIKNRIEPVLCETIPPTVNDDINIAVTLNDKADNLLDTNNLQEDCTKKTKEKKTKKPKEITDYPVLTPENQSSVHSNATEILIQRSMDELLLDVYNEKDNTTQDSLVECGIWDFAGPKDYYATHQTFLTPHAIYLLVVDITDELKAIRHNENVEYDYIRENVDFWLDTIHCFSDIDRNDRSAETLCPPVIMVCTGIDKIPVGEVRVRKREYEMKFLNVFESHKKFHHRRGNIHFISNKEPHADEIASLQKHISQIAKEMDYFAVTLPTRLINLENTLDVLKDSNKKFISLEEMKMLAYKEDLLLFLNYQHKIGNILFFEDIPEYIILQPKWLVMCFRCLVCDDNKKHWDFELCKEMLQLERKGIIRPNLIAELCKKEHDIEFKPKILEILEKFSIIVKDNKDSYYMPSAIKTSITLTDFIEKQPQFKNYQRTPWLVFEFQFLPIAYFDYIMCYYIKRYEVFHLTPEHPALYTGTAVVHFEKARLRWLFICFSKNAISLQIFSGEKDFGTNKDHEDIAKKICGIIDKLERKFRHSLSYEIKAKCSTGDYNITSGRISHHELTAESMYFCKEHNTLHKKVEIQDIWLEPNKYLNVHQNEEIKHGRMN